AKPARDGGRCPPPRPPAVTTAARQPGIFRRKSSGLVTWPIVLMATRVSSAVVSSFFVPIKPGLSEYRSSAPGDAWRSSAAAYERRPAWRCRHARLPGERSDAAGAHSYAARGSRETTRADRETSNPSWAQRATIHAISQEGW